MSPTRTAVVVAALALLAVALAACPPQNTPQPMPPGPGGGTGGYEPPPPPPDPPGGGTVEPPAGEVGAACDTAADCASGVCEGEGCGAGQGVCAAPDRVCTADVVQYCGCDGRTFDGSSSCAGARYAARGACAPLADGAACLADGDCASGVCEGQGCGPDEPGVCAPKSRACTKDLRPYCGCDGQTFRTSGSCPGRRYAAKGECP